MAQSQPYPTNGTLADAAGAAPDAGAAGPGPDFAAPAWQPIESDPSPRATQADADVVVPTQVGTDLNRDGVLQPDELVPLDVPDGVPTFEERRAPEAPEERTAAPVPGAPVVSPDRLTSAESPERSSRGIPFTVLRWVGAGVCVLMLGLIILNFGPFRTDGSTLTFVSLGLLFLTWLLIPGDKRGR